MEIPLLPEITTVFALAVGVALLCRRARIAPVVGLLITGVCAGPYGFGLIHSVEAVHMMAEIGVILLLFSIGLELSLRDLIKLKKPVFLGGGFQVAATFAVFGAIVALRGGPPEKSVIFGFLAALSSTAVVLKALQDRGQMETPHGRIILSILIFQDLAAVPMMLMVPMLSGHTDVQAASLLALAGKSAGVLLAVVFLAKTVVPFIFTLVVRARSRELFLLAALGLCFSISLLTAELGLSLSLGAFLAGLCLSESEYREQVVDAVLPFKDVFTSLFFISIGMLLDPAWLAAHTGLVCFAAGALLACKAALAGLTAPLLKYPLRTAVMVGLSLCQIGEFSFVLAASGRKLGLLDEHMHQLFLSAGVLTMALTPFLTAVAPRVADLAAKWFPQWSAVPDDEAASGVLALNDHLVILGFGACGRQLAKAAAFAGIDHVVMEMNPDTVRNERDKGVPIVYGDASRHYAQEMVRMDKARALAVVVSDPAAARKSVKLARDINPALNIIARTRFLSEIEPLRALGADNVVADEFETSIEIFSTALGKYLVPPEDIERFTRDIRREGYEMLRPHDAAAPPGWDLAEGVSGLDLTALTVAANAPVAGRSLSGLALRPMHGVSVAAVKRGENVFSNPDGAFILQQGDKAYVFGDRRALREARELFEIGRDA